MVSSSGWGSGGPRFKSNSRLICQSCSPYHVTPFQLGCKTAYNRPSIRNSDRQSNTCGVSNNRLQTLSTNGVSHVIQNAACPVRRLAFTILATQQVGLSGMREIQPRRREMQQHSQSHFPDCAYQENNGRVNVSPRTGLTYYIQSSLISGSGPSTRCDKTNTYFEISYTLLFQQRHIEYLTINSFVGLFQLHQFR